MKEEIPGEPCEDDLMLSTRAEAKFFHHLQLGDAVFHSQAYRGITRRNHHIDAYAQGGDIRYQQTEVFFMVVKIVDSVMICGAVLAQILKGETFCQYSTTQHWAFQSITLFPFPNQNRPFLPPEFLNFLLTLIDQLSSSPVSYTHLTLPTTPYV